MRPEAQDELDKSLEAVRYWKQKDEDAVDNAEGLDEFLEECKRLRMSPKRWLQLSDRDSEEIGWLKNTLNGSKMLIGKLLALFVEEKMCTSCFERFLASFKTDPPPFKGQG